MPKLKYGIVREQEVPFYQLQKRIILENNNLINPLDIRDYIALDGYQSLVKALRDMSPDQVIAEIKASGLRGRGARGSRPESNGKRVAIFLPTRNTWCATLTKGTRAQYGSECPGR